MATGRGLPLGLYEQIITDSLSPLVEAESAEAWAVGKMEELGVPPESLLVSHITESIRQVFRSMPTENRLIRQITLANEILAQLRASGEGVQLVDPMGRLLMEVMGARPGGHRPARPLTPLSQNSLLVNAPHEPRLGSEIAAELESADSVDLLCAFVIWSGVRTIIKPLRLLQERGIPVRIITTTYMGATEQRALDELVGLGARIKVSYESRTTRLHAKAWLFERNSGFSTAYIGSSNLSHSALHDGLEWNVRVSDRAAPELLERFRTTFESYWNDPRFEDYDAVRFAEVIGIMKRSESIDFAAFDIRPHPYQEEMLYRLDIERKAHNRWANLVVAATGTGKTVLAALDYRRVSREWGGASLLFVAHRKEILKQSLSTFRHVMKDGAFGELYVAGDRPDKWKHVFGSIQSLSADVIKTLPPDAFDVVIVDEFHHAAAKSYDRLLNHFQPKLLLGLTATPERADGLDITKWFEGHTAVELRLWEAVDQGMLCPFQYFGVSDETDLSSLEWTRGSYEQAALSQLYTGNDARVAKVLQAVRTLVADPLSMRALGFCVSVEHARYMAEKFTQAGIPSLAVFGTTGSEERDEALRKLREGEISVLFAVDLYNEGVDVPEIDTVLFLRPTESATIFLQQLGRGLRKAPNKSGLTILDFIGQQHRKFRFDLRLKALTGTPASQIQRQTETDFPFLPSGCHIQLDEVARRTILQNLKEALRLNQPALVAEVREVGVKDLSTFLATTGIDLVDVYRAGGWTSLGRSAGVVTEPLGPDEETLARGLARLVHVDDPERLRFFRRLSEAARLWDLSIREERLLTMLHYTLWGSKQKFASLDASFEQLKRNPLLLDELRQLTEVLEPRTQRLTQDLGLHPTVPLWEHASYTRDEVLGAVADATLEKPPSLREGVRWNAEHEVDLLFVTINKSEEHYSPTTMYKDYALSPTLFHWESQSKTSGSSSVGQRYANHRRLKSKVVLFARIDRGTRLGSAPYLCLGRVNYVSHTGDRPMAVVWELERALPPDFYEQARAVS